MSNGEIFAICFSLLVFIIFLLNYAKTILLWWDQKQTDRKRQRAHDGKVGCEETTEACNRTATVLTHNGYFCDEHWEQNSKYMVNGGYVTWHHDLYHVMIGSNRG